VPCLACWQGRLALVDLLWDPAGGGASTASKSSTAGSRAAAHTHQAEAQGACIPHGTSFDQEPCSSSTARRARHRLKAGVRDGTHAGQSLSAGLSNNTRQRQHHDAAGDPVDEDPTADHSTGRDSPGGSKSSRAPHKGYLARTILSLLAQHALLIPPANHVSGASASATAC
jgi:hypothetical protein